VESRLRTTLSTPKAAIAVAETGACETGKAGLGEPRALKTNEEID
jgi:hypothetical protein